MAGIPVIQNITKLFRTQEKLFADEVVDFVDKEYRRRQIERKPWELQWRLNIEFLNGNQYLDINPSSLTIEEVPKLFWYQEREVFNQIAPIVETRVSRLTQSEPILKVRPASSSDRDLSAARVESMLLQSTWFDQNMDQTYANMVSWMEVSGTVFLKTVWNKDKGRIISTGPVPKDQDSDLTGENPAQADAMDTYKTPEEADFVFGGNENIDYITMREGDIDTVVVPAHELFPDTCWNDGFGKCRSVIHARAYHVEEIENMWGVRVDPEYVDVITLQAASTGLGGLGYGYGSFRTGITKLKDHAVVKEYYEKPTRKFPQGRLIVIANKELLFVGKLPYKIGEDQDYDFPFIRTVSIHHPGCFWGKSVIERLIPLQRRYNALRNRKAEWLNLVAIGQWYEPEGSLADDEDLNNAPGNRIRYRPTGNGMLKPEPVVFPSLPASFDEEINTLMNEFTQISAISELSRMSEAPPGVKSGVALSIAQSQDDTRVSSISARIANAIVALGQVWIRLYRQYVNEPRTIRLVGDQYDVEVMDWMTSDLRSDDVIIENSASLAETPAQRRAMVFNLMAAGMFNDPNTGRMTPESRMKVFQLLEFGNWEQTADDDNMLQKQRSRRENKMILQLQPPQVMDFDDHMVHIKEHNHQRMQPDYDQLLKIPMVGQMIDMVMRQHIAMHMQAMIEGMQAQMPLVAQQPELPAGGSGQGQQQPSPDNQQPQPMSAGPSNQPSQNDLSQIAQNQSSLQNQIQAQGQPQDMMPTDTAGINLANARQQARTQFQNQQVVNPGAPAPAAMSGAAPGIMGNRFPITDQIMGRL